MRKKKISMKAIGIIILLLVILTGIIVVLLKPWHKESSLALRPLDFDSGKPMIGFSIDALIIERWQRDIDIFKTRAEELGFEVEVVNAYESAETQEAQISALVDEGAVAIVIIAHDMNALVDSVDKVKKEGVLVIAYDRLITNANVDAYVSFDNVAVGKYLGEALSEKVPSGNYVIINGSPQDHNSLMFNEGYMNVLNPLIESGEIIVVEEVWADGWREDIAYEVLRRRLEEGVHIDGVLCANDLLAEGAISALLEYGLAGDVAVVGHDADISACQRIVEGKQLMTVYKPLRNLAEGAVDLIYRMLQEEIIESETTINDGTYDVPFYKFDVIPVNSENMEATVIKDFFHSKEDIYRLDLD